jgi:enterochelin esterase family protein
VTSGVALHSPLSFAGRVELPLFESALLRGNRAGDPHLREVPVYLPPSYAAGPPLPVVFLLAGFTGRGHDFLETHPWRRGVVAQYDALVARGEAPAAILVMPDGFTKFGGSQYVDSALLGPYASYVARELTGFVDARYRTRQGARAVVGKSSGGFGALHLALTQPSAFSAVASISGDCAFELCYGGDLLACCRGLVPFDGDPAAFLADFARTPTLDGDRHAVLNVLAMSACYSPNLAAPLGFDLPIDVGTAERVDAVWQRWLAFDPLVACEKHAEALRALTLLHIECGLRDEYHLQWGARRLARKLTALGVRCDHEEHAGSHRNLSERYLLVLPKLIRALQAR